MDTYSNLSTEEEKNLPLIQENQNFFKELCLKVINSEQKKNLEEIPENKRINEDNLKKQYQKKIILKSIIVIFLSFIGIWNYKFLFESTSENPRITIEIDTSGSYVNNAGPSIFSRSLKNLLPYDTDHCHFIDGGRILPKNVNQKSDYFYLPWPRYSESTYDKWSKNNKSNSLILGPCFVPTFWNSFPIQSNWKERRFREILTSINGLVTHSDRVRDHLLQRSNTTDLISKVILVSACTNLKPNFTNSFENRTNDIILFEKFPDLNRRKQAAELFKLLNSTKKVTRLIYGEYTFQQMTELANNSKYIIYFSFYDTGAIGLKEIQNFGVFTFSHQKDLVIDNKTSFYIPELTAEKNMKPAFSKIMEIIDSIEKSNSNSEFIAKTNQEITKCENAFEQLCQGIVQKKSEKK